MSSIRYRNLAAWASVALLSVIVQGQCGTTGYDTGGPGGNYGANQNLTWTYCAPPGQVVTLNFTQFSVELNWDFLTIHDGPSNTSPALAGYTGTGALPPFTSSGRCITLWFTSDGSGQLPGWAVNITCSTPPIVPGGCRYLLSLYDEFGDGWGTSNVGVQINGGAFTYYTVGGISNQVPINLNNGDVVVLSYNNSGAFQGENSYTFGLPAYSPFFSSGSPPTAGVSFSQLVTCQIPPEPPQDCSGGFTICGGQSINNNSINSGNMYDLNGTNRGCLQGGEQQGTWYYFSPSATGTVAFTIQPSANIDFDFAVWGPMTAVTCPPAGAPIRCSWALPNYVPGYPAAGAYLTGMRTTSADVSEDQGPIPAVDGFTSALNVIAGQVYILYIDNFNQTGQSFNLNWSLTNGASLDCTILPIGEVSVKAESDGADVQVEWTTAYERDASHFIVERSSDAVGFHSVGSLGATGNTSSPTTYVFKDNEVPVGLNYYRIRSIDLDGNFQYSPSVGVLMTQGSHFVIAPNPLTDHASLFLRVPHQGQLILRTTDPSGRVVHQHFVTMAEGDQQVDLKWPRLDAGSYLLVVFDATGEQLAHLPFVRQ